MAEEEDLLSTCHKADKISSPYKYLKEKIIVLGGPIQKNEDTLQQDEPRPGYSKKSIINNPSFQPKYKCTPLRCLPIIGYCPKIQNNSKTYYDQKVALYVPKTASLKNTIRITSIK
tara:strand:- start:366 stop:713 length:348 start_codon:yes stop_codon:yes gene_type:complete